jgi:hypothetical protein
MCAKHRADFVYTFLVAALAVNIHHLFEQTKHVPFMGAQPRQHCIANGGLLHNSSFIALAKT